MREFLNTPAGKVVAIILIVIGEAAAAYSIMFQTGNSVVAGANEQVFVDAATGLSFTHRMHAGEIQPIVAPSGGKTGYIPEQCTWTADGHAKSQPDYVLLNENIGKSGLTFCPVCGRLVVAHNPHAIEGQRPPPTKQQYLSRRGS